MNEAKDRSQDDRVEQALADYMMRVDAGEDVDREAFIAEHPNIEADLRSYFADAESIGKTTDERPEDFTESVKSRRLPPVVIPYFGDYVDLVEIAQGGMGVVYKARQKSLNRTVAIKMMSSGPRTNSDELERFRAEAEMAARLHHPNIVRIHEVGCHEGEHYFSMDYVANDLKQLIHDGPLAPHDAARYVSTIATAVQYAHDEQVLHRDLKPSNVLIDERGEPIVTDFGLAKRINADSGMTQSGIAFGTPNYMAPEQARGDHKSVGVKSDVYSLGAILYELLTGTPPHSGATTLETLKMIGNHEPVTPRLLNRNVPRDLETICLKCLEKKPEARYHTSGELAADLVRYRDGRPILAKPIGTLGRVNRWARRNQLAASLLFSTILVLVAGVAISTRFAMAARRNADLANRALHEATTQRELADRNAQQAKEQAVRASLQTVRLSEAVAKRELREIERDRLATPRVVSTETALARIAQLSKDATEPVNALASLEASEALAEFQQRLTAHQDELRDEATRWLTLPPRLVEQDRYELTPPRGSVPVVLSSFRSSPAARMQVNAAINDDGTLFAILSDSRGVVMDKSGKAVHRLSVSRTRGMAAWLQFTSPSQLEFSGGKETITWLLDEQPVRQESKEADGLPASLSGGPNRGGGLVAEGEHFRAECDWDSRADLETVSVRSKSEAGTARIVWSRTVRPLHFLQRIAFSKDEQILFILTNDQLVAVDHQRGTKVELSLSGSSPLLDLIPTATGAATLALANANASGRTRMVSDPTFQITNWIFETRPTSPLDLASRSNRIAASRTGVVIAGSGKMRVFRHVKPAWSVNGRGLADERAGFYRAFPFHAFSDTNHLVVDRIKLSVDGNTRRVTEVYSTGDGALVETFGQVINISRDRRFAVIAESLTDRGSSLQLFSVGEAKNLFDLGEYAIGTRSLPTSFHMTSGIRAVFSPNSKIVAVCDLTAGRTAFWSIPDGKQLANVETPGGAWEVVLSDEHNVALATIGHDDESYEQWLIELASGTITRKWKSAATGLHWRGVLGNRLVGFSGKSPDRRALPTKGVMNIFEVGFNEAWELGTTQWDWNTGSNIGSSVELLPKIRVNREETRLFVVGISEGGVAAELWDLTERKQVMSWKPDQDPTNPVTVQAAQNSPVIDVGASIHALGLGNSWDWSNGNALQNEPQTRIIYDQRDASVRLGLNQNPRWILLRDKDEFKLMTDSFEGQVSMDSGVPDSIPTGYAHPAQDRLNTTGDRFAATAGVYDSATGRQLASFPIGHDFRTYDLTGRWLLTIDRQQRAVRIWDTTTGELAHAFTPAWDDRWMSRLDGMSVDTTGTRVTVQSHGTIVLWDAERNQQILAVDKPHHLHLLTRLAQSNDGKLVVSGDSEGTLHFRDGDTGESLGTVLAHTGSVEDVSVSDDGQVVASVGVDRRLRLWNGQGEPLANGGGAESAAPVKQLQIASDGKRLCCVSTSESLYVFDIESGAVKRLGGDNSSPVTSLATSEGSPYVAAGFADGKVQIWNIDTHELFDEWSSSGAVSALAFSDSKTLIVGGENVVFWDVADSSVLWTIDVGDDPVTQLALTSENIVVATQYKVQQYDLSSLRQRLHAMGLSPGL